MRPRGRDKAQADKATLDLLFELHKKGIPLKPDQIATLKKEGYIKDKPLPEVPSAKKQSLPEIIDRDLSRSPDKDVVVTTTQGDDLVVQTTTQPKIYSEKRKITKKMWMPESRVYHSAEFVAWIDSINREDGFYNSIDYDLFDIYCQQADQWLAEVMPDNMTDNELMEYQIREVERCCENTLYACNRYGRIRDNNEHGVKQYIARKAHRILLYLFDCGYSMNIAKARQVAFTTTMCMAAMYKAGFNLDLVIKFISETDKKAQMTFDSKVKYPYSMLPEWIRPISRNDNIRELYFGEKKKKGITEGNNSSMEVLAPTTTAIASSTPDITFIDEAGNIEILNKLLSDLEPTLYGYSTKTDKIELLRSVIMWGTGGEMQSFGAAFAAVYLKHKEEWDNRQWGSGIVPLLFNVWWRPGMTKEKYESLRAEAYAMQGPKAEEMRIRFHQSYPISLSDVFLTGGKTLKPLEYINSQLDRIATTGQQPDYGYFEPIYDTNSPAHEGSDVPFKIIGANFIPCTQGDERITTAIFLHPKPWINRYFQGTDPIAADNGHSKMASVIWDAHFATPVAVMNFRTDNYRYVFLQTVLLGLYYNTDKDKQSTVELVESNIGTAYREYKENKNLGRALVIGTELPPIFQTRDNTVKVGIDNKGLRNAAIINLMHQVFDTFGDKIYLPVFYNQLKTFTCKMSGRTEIWEPIDRKHYWDDTLFALTFAYLCSQCFAHLVPEEMSGEKAQARYHKVRYELYHDTDGQLKRRVRRPEAKPQYKDNEAA